MAYTDAFSFLPYISLCATSLSHHLSPLLPQHTHPHTAARPPQTSARVNH